MENKKEILNKIYKNKFESESQLRDYMNDAKHHLEAIDELNNNILLCEELIDMLLKDTEK